MGKTLIFVFSLLAYTLTFAQNCEFSPPKLGFSYQVNPQGEVFFGFAKSVVSTTISPGVKKYSIVGSNNEKTEFTISTKGSVHSTVTKSENKEIKTYFSFQNSKCEIHAQTDFNQKTNQANLHFDRLFCSELLNKWQDGLNQKDSASCQKALEKVGSWLETQKKSFNDQFGLSLDSPKSKNIFLATNQILTKCQNGLTGVDPQFKNSAFIQMSKRHGEILQRIDKKHAQPLINWTNSSNPYNLKKYEEKLNEDSKKTPSLIDQIFTGTKEFLKPNTTK